MDRTLHIETYYDSLPGMLRKFDAHARRRRFKGKTYGEFLDWQAETRLLLKSILGFDMMEACSLSPVTEESVRLGNGIRREKVRIRVEPDTWMPVYILVPENRGAGSRVFITPPGHQGAGKFSVAGCADIPAVAERIRQYNYDYGFQLARLGHVALCPDCRGFGERRDAALQRDDEAAFMGSTCFHLAHMAEPLGMTVAGMLTWDLMRLVDYVGERGEWDMDTLSCLGFSGGGMQTLWLSALDERVRLAVISGYMYGFKDSLLKLNGNCSCNYVPGLWKYVDMGDIASLIAPRPLVIQSCRGDHLNGERGLANVEEQVAVVREAYRLAGAEEKLYHQICEGGHRWHDEGLTQILEIVAR